MNVSPVHPVSPDRHAAQVSEWQEQVRFVAAAAGVLHLVGGNSKHWYGAPGPEPEAGRMVSRIETRAHGGIVAYEPDELVVTARCGMRLTELEDLLTQHGQMLAFEPPHFKVGGEDRATVGGMLAAGLAGPRRAQAGSVRDFLLGVQIIDGRGQCLNFGGQVMKNVAGYDVSRVMAGAMGTLGLVLQASFKVLPRPGFEGSVRWPCTQQAALQWLWQAPPSQVSASCWHDGVLTVRLSGAQVALAGLQAQCLALPDAIWLEHHATLQALSGSLAGHAAPGSAFWQAVRDQQHPFFELKDGERLWRLSLPPTAPELIVAGRQLIEWGGAERWLASSQNAATIRRVAASCGGHATLFRVGPGAMPHGDPVFHPMPPALARLNTRLRAEFDPAGIFNPGRLPLDGET